MILYYGIPPDFQKIPSSAVSQQKLGTSTIDTGKLQ